MRIIISGGGTGGHIFPAIAIANALKEIDKDIEILFVGAEGRMEMEKVPDAGYKIEGLWISGLQRRLTVDNLSFPFKVMSSIMRSKKIIKNFGPDVAVGTGGFASGPLLRVASRMGIPTLIQEQNAFPGITNRILGRKVDKVCVVYEGMERYFAKKKIILTGNPVRRDIQSLEGKKEEAMKVFGLNPASKTLLVIGGSLGAKTINESILASLELLTENNIQVIWQTGKAFIEKAEKGFTKAKGWVGAFITEMDLAYAAADIVVSRAGAISISELAIVKKPVILVPSPNVAEDHQTKNAMTLVNNNAAILVKDIQAREKLGKEIVALIKDLKKQQTLTENIGILSHPNAAEVIAKEIIKLAKK
jgi:UDP-N-acetylglucosamine--N-acetylmuramyl-(pentapeptide) pyrophosphoryl-undecaprenol N-acetylglucosamine transferase